MKTKKTNNPHRGGNFEDFLEKEGVLAEINVLALKKVLALQLQKIIDEQRLTKSELASKMHTSRASVDRLLDPENTSLTVMSLGKAAAALGKKVEVRFLPA